MVRELFSIVGFSFIDESIGNHVRGLIASGASLEVDPSKLGSGGGNSVSNNLLKLEEAVARVISSVISLVPTRLPADVFSFFGMLFSSLNQFFPGENDFFKASAGFLFLRWICPAIFSPVFFSLTEVTPSPESQRSLVLVAKVVQNIANGVEFGQKENYLIPLNPLVKVWIAGRLNKNIRRPEEKNSHIPSFRFRNFFFVSAFILFFFRNIFLLFEIYSCR